MITPKNKFIRSMTGGSLVLVAFVGIGIVFAVFAIVYIYNQLFTHQREAQTAIDAAALAVSKEISQVTTQDPFLGWVGVTDGFQPNLLQQQPVYGINTVIGRARLDNVICRALNNNDMTLLANRDSLQSVAVANSLRTILNSVDTNGGTLRYTRPGPNNAPQQIVRNLAQIAADAYNSNNLRAVGNARVTPAQVRVELGYIQGDSNGLTDIPIPSPNNMSGGAENANFSAQVNGVRFYRAGVNVPVTGSPNQYVFSCVTTQPHLVDRQSFVNAAPNPMLVPTVVKVTINQQVDRPNPTGGGDMAANKMEVACASAGGQRVPTTAGILRLEFPQGIPQDQNRGNRFASIRAILDAGNSAWAGRGNFFTAQGGAFPGNGRIVAAAYPPSIPAAGAGDPTATAASAATPSQLTAYYVYDWLRNDCLRPNVQSVINALNANLRTTTGATANSRSVQIGDASKMMFTQFGDFFIQKAWAQGVGGVQCNNIWGGLFDLIPDSTSAMARGRDPRSLNNFDDEPNAFVDQAYVFRMQASTPQQLAWAPRNTMATGLDLNTGCPTTAGPNPQPAYILLDLREDLAAAQNNAMQTYDNARLVYDSSLALMNQYTAEMNSYSSQMSSITAQMAALNNGSIVYLAQASGQYAAGWYSIQLVPFGGGGFWTGWGFSIQIIPLPGFNGLTPGANLQTLTAQYNELLAKYNATKALYDQENRKYARASVVMLNGIRVIDSANAIIDNMLAISSLGINRTNPPAPSSTARPRRYVLGGNAIVFSPPENVMTKAQVEGTVALVSTGQIDNAPGDRNWLGNVLVSTGNPGAIQTPNCPISVRPSSQARNFELVTVGDASNTTSGGAVQLTVSGDAPTNDGSAPTYDQGQAANYRAQANSFDSITGVSALLEGQSQYQALNVYRVASDCDRDPANSRFGVDWSVMAQNNVTNFSNPTVDVRAENTPGNRLDCASAAQTNNPNERACRHEAVRIQVTSPLLEVPPLLVVTPPPPPVAAPPVPPIPPPPPPPPPRRSH
ncbi:MAG: hypothetical protein K2W82_19700 [Candidatus Obscuribacterales bacterium]|nr:hypothetical protein [Candidatus Obscuribacterales bacterium]